MNNVLDIKEVITLFKRKRLLIIFIVLFSTLLGGLVNFKIPPTFVAKTDLLVNYTTMSEESTVLQSGDIEMSLRLIETYKQIMKSDRMLGNVISRLEEPYTISSLVNSTSIESSGNSQIITIVAEEKTAEKAAILVNTYATTFQDEVKSLMNLENIHILNEISADRDVKEVKPSPIIFIVISCTLGFILSVIIILIQEFYFIKLNTAQRTEDVLNIPNLGIIPDINKKRTKKSAQNWNGKLISNSQSPISFTEEFRRIRSNVQYYMTQKNAKTILVTSPVQGDGKSLISSNLAIIMAMGGKKTIYIDADLRKPDGRSIFNLPKRNGLTSLIAGHYQLEDVLQKTSTNNLSFIGPGPIPPNPAEVLSSDEMVSMINQLKEQFDVIIIDTPALIVADAISLSTVVDGCVYVIDARRTKEEVASISLEQLRKVKAPLLGSILNKSYTSTKDISYEF